MTSPDPPKVLDLIKGEAIGVGRLAYVFDWQPGKVIKLFRQGVNHNEVEYEYKICKLISQIDVATPKVFEIVREDGWIGIVFEKINGNTMVKDLPKFLLRMKKLAHDFAALQYSFHKEEIGETNEVDLPQYHEQLSRNIDRTSHLQEDQKKKIQEGLEKLPRMNRLCHGDYHPDNVINENGALIAIDWVTASQGHPLFDVARTSYLLNSGSPPELGFIQRILIQFIRNRFHSLYLKYYLELSSYEAKDLEPFYLPVMAARLRENIEEERESLKLRIEERLEKIE